MASTVAERLLRSSQPSIRWKVRVKVWGEDPDSRGIRKLRQEIRDSAPVRAMLSGNAAEDPSVYNKWKGSHWVIQSLAELGYPPGDERLQPLVAKVAAMWLSKHYTQEYDASETMAGRRVGVPRVNGTYRRCGSIQGGALLALVKLGLCADEAAQLAELLLHWQWPDGGWNCDRHADASMSSIFETHLSLQGLAAFAAANDDPRARAGANRAADVLLERRVVYRRSNGKPIRPDWLKLHYPVYWRYDLLAGLKALAEVGMIDDVRCAGVLDLLQSKALPDGGWAAEAKHYRVSGEPRERTEYVDWGGVQARAMNEWVTADALTVLAAAGRLGD
jgi:hypothetical protein